MAEPALERLLSLKAAATLRRHLLSWRLWLAFGQHHERPVNDPPAVELVGLCYTRILGAIMTPVRNNDDNSDITTVGQA